MLGSMMWSSKPALMRRPEDLEEFKGLKDCLGVPEKMQRGLFLLEESLYDAAALRYRLSRGSNKFCLLEEVSGQGLSK